MKKNWRWSLSLIFAIIFVAFLGEAAIGQEDTTKVTKTAPMTVEQLVAQAKAVVPEITVEQAKANIDKKMYKVILDVREPKKFRGGHLTGAINIPRGLLEFKITKKIEDKTTPILVYCKKGERGALSGQTLMIMGYTNVTNMDGGWKAWVKAGYPVE